MENITPFDLGGLAKDLDNQLIGMRSPFGPAEDRQLHDCLLYTSDAADD